MTLIKLNLLCPRPSRLFSLELRVATSAPRGGRTGMTTSNVPEAALTPEQWRLVETLAQSVTPSQARSEEHTSTPVTNAPLVCRLFLEKKTTHKLSHTTAPVPITTITTST